MEHLNRTVKDHVAHLRANVAEKSIIQCSQSLKGIMEVCQHFDEQLMVRPDSTSHSKASVTRDENMIIQELTERYHVFDYIPGRTHPTFKSIRPSIAEHINKVSLVQWIQKKKTELQREITMATVFSHPV